MTTITERVAAGAAFLDEHDPQWWRADVERAIDLKTLDLRLYDSCILGQRCPLEVLAAYLDRSVHLAFDDDDETQKYDAYGEAIAADFNVPGWPQQHGFNGWDGDEFKPLTAEWKRVIWERRDAATAAGEGNGNG